MLTSLASFTHFITACFAIQWDTPHEDEGFGYHSVRTSPLHSWTLEEWSHSPYGDCPTIAYAIRFENGTRHWLATTCRTEARKRYARLFNAQLARDLN